MKKSLIFVGMLAVGYANAQYDGKVGVNTETPSATFNVKSKTGNNATTKNFELENADGTKMVTVLDNGNVGIGTDAPAEKLNVVGGIRSTGSSNGGGYLDIENTLKTGDTEGARWRLYNMTDKQAGTTYTPGLHFWNYSYSTTQPNLGSKMLLTDNGNLGIGLGSRGVPSEKLHVAGGARITSLAGTGDRVVLADATGVLKAGTLPATSISGAGNLTGTGITVGNGAGATLKNVTLAIADNAITSAKIADGQVALADLAVNSVDSSKIVDKSIVAADLNQMGAANGQVLKWNGTAWAPAADTDTNTTYTGSTSVALSGNSFQRAALTGDVTATANSNATTVARIQGRAVANTAPTNGQVLKWNGTAWAPAADTDTNTNTNIYTTDGTLTGARTVNMNGNNLLFTGKGNIAIGTNVSSERLRIFNNDINTQLLRVIADNSTGLGVDDVFWESYGTKPILTHFFKASRGTFASPAPLQNGDHIFNYEGVARVNTGDIGVSNFEVKYRGNGTTPLSSTNIVNSAQSAIYINESNNVGIGTTTPQQKLHVLGTYALVQGAGNEQAYIGGDNANQDVQLGSLNPAVSQVTLWNPNRPQLSTGNMSLNVLDLLARNITATSVTQTSDARFKQDVQPISNATATLNGLRSVTYHWNKEGKAKGGNDALQYGFIAQEVEKVLPALVSTDAQGYKSVNYTGVIPILVKALQEKDAKIQELEARLEKLEKLLK